MSGEAMAILEPSRRWTARAASAAGIEAELARIWGAAARESRAAHLTAQGMATAMTGPRLAGRLDEAGDVGVRMRTSVLTLIAIAERPESEERALGAIGALSARHPSRTIVLAPGDPDGPAWLDARILAECRIAVRGGAETCTEQILVRTGGEFDQHLAALVQPLLIHDLPVLLWWPDDPPFEHARFRGLIGSYDRLLLDSTTFRDEAAGMAAMAGLCARPGTVVYDIGWMRLTRWRDLLASVFDHPGLAAELAGVRSLHIDVLGQGDQLRQSKAALFAGWLAAVLGWQVAAPLAAEGGSGTLSGAFRHGRRRIPVVIGPAIRATDQGHAAQGSLFRVEIGLAHRGDDVTAVMTRHLDHLLATAHRSGAEVARRARWRLPSICLGASTDGPHPHRRGPR
jgi:glucose-6-phosphate dehydrogenase assembly protein OpcA